MGQECRALCAQCCHVFLCGCLTPVGGLPLAVLQGYTRLLKVLGSNLAEFLQNLNDLHLHLQYCWPDMLAPAFRCEEVSGSSSHSSSSWRVVLTCTHMCVLHPLCDPAVETAGMPYHGVPASRPFVEHAGACIPGQ